MALLSLACSDPPAQYPKIRIVLVTLDTVRLDSLMGGGRLPSKLPKTLAFASEGTNFTAYYSASNVTQPAHASIFTAKQPWEHGVTRNGQVLGNEFETVAEVLSQNGFATAAVVSSFPMRASFGFKQGFASFDASFQNPIDNSGTWEGAEVPDGRFFVLADRVTDRALHQLDAARSESQFFWFHYFDAHDPYGDTQRGGETIHLGDLFTAKKAKDDFELRLDQARRLYHSDLEFLDNSLGVLWARLLADSESVETHIIVVSDHGESFGEDNAIGHGYSLSPREVHVPLFIISPRVARGTRKDIVGSIDIAATILDLGGVVSSLGGRSLVAKPSASDAKKLSALGMSRSFLPKYRQRPRFFSFRDGAYFAGDAEGILLDDKRGVEAPKSVREELAPLFAKFAQRYRENEPGAMTDALTLQALEALGYLESPE